MGEIVRKNPVNEPSQKPVKTHSKFSPNYSLYQGPTFGLNTPFFAMAGVADDDISMRLSSDIDTYSLQAPSMTPIKRSVDYFMVPVRCLLPNAAELLITNPLRGDDVVAADVNAVLSASEFNNWLNAYLQSFSKMSQPTGTTDYFPVPTDSSTMNSYLKSAFNWLKIGSLFFSRQSLVKNLGYAFDELPDFTKVDANNVPEHFDFDHVFGVLFDYLITQLDKQQGNLRAITVTYRKPDAENFSGQPSDAFTTYSRVYGVGVSSYGYLSMADLVYDIAFGDDLVYSVSCDFTQFSEGGAWINPWKDDNDHYYQAAARQLMRNVNLLRVLAYQKASAEFYTVDTVDDVYSASLYEKNLLQWAFRVKSYSYAAFFEVNGVNIPYDAAAGYYLTLALKNGFRDLALYGLNSWNAEWHAWCYFSTLLQYTRSLRYQDYFVGSRVRPLAVGDVSVSVNSNVVDIVDVTKKIQVQRFLNQVNRVGRKFSEYVKGILGDRPMPDAHEPIFLGHVVDTIGASEVTNTGEAQQNNPQSKTSNYRASSNRYAFTVHVSEPAVIIGIQNFDIPRVYSTVTDRENFHIDRYDMFNPYMQFVGDQEVFRDEIMPGFSGNFGYQLRYAEYKQRVSMASGPFIGDLPGYAKIYDRKTLLKSGSDTDAAKFEINSDFIRANINDIDEFYLKRYVNSPKSSFHFIIRNDMEVTAHRPMAFAPSIL